MKMEFKQWLDMMNLMLDVGKENGYVIYNFEEWDNGYGRYKTIDSFNKSDIFEDTAWYSQKGVE